MVLCVLYAPVKILSTNTQPLLSPGQRFAGRYQIVRKIGAGGFGAVYLAHQGGMDREVALKLLSVSQTMSAPQQNTAKERFLREVRIVSKLRHPNSVTIHDFGQGPNGELFMVLEYIQGETLKQATARGPMPPARALRITAQIAEALGEAHDLGIVHRDLKPSNIMLTRLGAREDHVKVLDFGIAHLFVEKTSQDLTQAGFGAEERAIIGTPRYMSPEQIHGQQDLAPTSDIYSLGLLMYEMLAGRPAIDASATIQIIAKQASPTPLELPAMAALPRPIAGLLQAMLQKNPARRR